MDRSGILLLICIILTIFSCRSERKNYPSPDHYDLSAPEKMSMKESLLEISGITYLSNDTVLALNDEEGIIFSVPWLGKRNRHTRFASDGDFEEVAKYKSWIFALRSDGTIYVLPEHSANRASTKKLEDILPKGEYESLYADESINKLFVLCKRCKSKERKRNILQGYTFELTNDHIGTRETFTIDISSLVSLPNDKEKKFDFAPSAIAKNKLTNEWYILSSKDKALLITDENWKAKQLFPLDPGTFNQPEGISFDDNHNLYISNEGDELQYGNILKFAYKEAGKK